MIKKSLKSMFSKNKESLFLENYYKEIYENLSVPLFVINGKGNIIFANKSFLNFSNYNYDELNEKSFSEFFDFDGNAFSLFSQLTNTGEIQLQAELKNHSGNKNFVKLYGDRISDDLISFIVEDKTEAVEFEKKLKDSETKWKFVLEGSGLGVWDYNTQTKKMFFSNQWKTMLGYDIDEIGDSINEWFERIHPDDFDKCKSDFEKHITNQSSYFQNEHRLKSKDGSYRWMFSRGKVIEWTETGMPLRIIGTHFDITTRKNTEEMIFEREVHFRTIFNSTTDALLVVEDLVITDCNQSALYLFDCNKDKIIGQNLISFILRNETKQETQIKIRRIIAEALDGKQQYFEYKLLRENNTSFDADLFINRFEVKDYFYLLVIIRDISEKKKNYEIITSSELRFRTIFNTSQNIIVINNIENGKFLSVNPAFELTSGYSKEEVLGKSIIELGFIKNVEEYKELLKTLKEDKKVDNYKTYFYDKNGNIHYVLISSAPITFEDTTAILSTVVDITNIERAEQHLRHAQKLDVVGQLAGGVAHDFNNMLSGILGFAELLKMKLKNEPSLVSYVDKIVETANRSSDLTKKLLAFARKGKTISTPIDIHVPIKEAVSLLERSIDKRIKIVLNLNAKYSTLIGDPSLLQNAFLNLGVNARDAMPNGGTLTFSTNNFQFDENTLKSNFASSEPGTFIEIQVSDTGTGIEKDIIDKIFEPFFTTKEVGKGTGLGLAAVYGTVKEHRGFIKVVSEINIGTIFKIYLPVDKNLSSENKDFEPEPLQGTGKILFVDDEEIILNLGYSQLTNLGYEVILAEDGMKAIEIFKERHKEIFAVILDMIMPGINGKDTFIKLKEIDPNVKVIFSSGFSHEGRINELINLGGIAFLQKPYRIYDLSKLLFEIKK